MFTGLVEATGECEANIPQAQEGCRFVIRCDSSILNQLTLGDSIALDGACTTVIALNPQSFEIEASPETLRKTIMGSYKAGRLINLELPLKAGEELGGHFVTGHVDGLGEVTAIEEEGLSWIFHFRFTNTQWNDWLIEKGSIAINGISLTVNDVKPNSFSVAIIPHTWDMTNIRKLVVGQAVNLEFDMLGKYVAKLAEAHLAKR
jgi:riboflavin synthase